MNKTNIGLLNWILNLTSIIKKILKSIVISEINDISVDAVEQNEFFLQYLIVIYPLCQFNILFI